MLKFLPREIEYIGFDRNPEYINKAIKLYRHRNANFYCEELSFDSLGNEHSADIVLAFGLIHHLDDTQTQDLFRLAKKLLVPSGFLLTLDPVFVPQQSFLARYIISKDRGTAVRTELWYKKLAMQVFSQVEVFIQKDPLRIPYTGIVMKCSFG